MAAAAEDAPKEKYALVVCDCQEDLLKPLGFDARKSLYETLQLVIKSARDAHWPVVFTGYRFPSRYEGLSSRHRVFGAFRRINEKMGDEKAHWLMDGHAGCEIAKPLAPQNGEVLAWRTALRHGDELIRPLRDAGVTRVLVTGIKASQGVLSACHALVDQGMLVYCIRDGIEDEDDACLTACLDLLLPKLADVKTWEELRKDLGEEMMMEQFVEVKRQQADTSDIASATDTAEAAAKAAAAIASEKEAHAAAIQPWASYGSS